MGLEKLSSKKVNGHTYSEYNLHHWWMTDSLYDETVFKIDGKKVKRSDYYKKLKNDQSTVKARKSVTSNKSTLSGVNKALADANKKANNELNKGDNKKKKTTQKKKKPKKTTKTTTTTTPSTQRKDTSRKQTRTVSSHKTSTHITSSSPKSIKLLGSPKSPSTDSNYFNFRYCTPDEIVSKINKKYNQIFLASSHIKTDFTELQSLISNLEKVVTELNKIESNYDDTKKPDNAKVYTISNVPQIPKWIDKVKNPIYKKGSKDCALYNLKTGAKKCVAAYYRKEYDDCDRFLTYARCAVNAAEMNEDSNIKGDWEYAIRKVGEKVTLATTRKQKAKNNENRAKNSLYKNLFKI